jgi:peptidylprolyl isomerase
MNIKTFSKVLIAIVVVAAISFSCKSGKNSFPGFSQTEDGLFYKYHTHGTDTNKAHVGDKITAVMSYRTMADSVFSSSQASAPFEIPMMESTYDGDVFAALGMMSPGDSATFVISTDSFFQKTVGSPAPEYLDSGSFFYLDIKMLNIQTPEQMEAERLKMEKEQMEIEKVTIQEYMSANKIAAIQDPSGIFIARNKAGKGAKPVAGSYAKLQLVAKTLGAQGAEFINTYKDGKLFEMEVGTGQLGVGFETGILSMQVGEKATFIVPFNLAFGAKGYNGFIPPFATIVFDAELVEVISAEAMQAKRDKEAKEAAAKEQKDIAIYLKANKITAKPTPSGLYFVPTVQGSGKMAQAGKKVKVHYTGYLLNGTKFDSSLDRNEPFEFVLGQGNVIPGWDEGLSMMKEGGKAKLVIPSSLGYGARGAGEVIPPSSPLVFEVELIKVLD